MKLRELDPDSIHWGGYSGMKLQIDPNDPLPNPLLGGLDADDFLAHHLKHASNPLSSGLGLLVDLESGVSESTTMSAAWSLRDPSSSFYEDVFDCIFAPPGPALPSDSLRRVPRVVDQVMSVRGVQATKEESKSKEEDSGVIIDTQIVTQVNHIL